MENINKKTEIRGSENNLKQKNVESYQHQPFEQKQPLKQRSVEESRNSVSQNRPIEGYQQTRPPEQIGARYNQNKEPERASSGKSQKDINNEIAGKVQKMANRKAANLGRYLALKLNEEIEKGEYKGSLFIAYLLAIAKDLLDIFVFVFFFFLTATGLGSIAVFMLWIPFKAFSVFLTVFIFYFLWMNGIGFFQKQAAKHFIRALLWILFGNLPVFNIFPLTTFYVFLSGRKVKKRAEKAKEKQKELKQMSYKEMERLNEDISRIEYE